MAPVQEEAPVEEPKEEVVDSVVEEEPIQEPQIEETEAIVEEVPDEVEEEEVFDDYKEEKFVGKHRLSVVFIVLAIMFLGVLGTVGYYYVYVPMTIYNRAVEVLNSKNYDEAIILFKDLGNYRNSKEMVSEAIYRKANDFYSKKQYVDAANLFKQIDYKGSQERVKTIKNQFMQDAQVDSTIIFGKNKQ